MVSVGGGVVHSGSLKLAAVTTGLKVKVEGADVLQCEADDTEGATATITIQEAGFASSIVGTNEFVVSFIGIPEGVTVRVPKMEAAELTLSGDRLRTSSAHGGERLDSRRGGRHSASCCNRLRG